MIKNYYHLLGIGKDASQEEIKQSFRLYALKFHPDRHKGDKFFEEKFKEIQEAYETLSNAEKRREYDKKLFGSKNFVNSSNNEQEKQAFKRKQKPKAETIFETSEQKAKKLNSEKRSKNFLIGLGTTFAVFVLFSIGGEQGMHVPIAMFFIFWTIRQIFVVLISFVPD